MHYLNVRYLFLEYQIGFNIYYTALQIYITTYVEKTFFLNFDNTCFDVLII